MDDPQTVPPQIAGLQIVASMSGGKDSTALALWLEENHIPFTAVFMDTGWEAPETYEYVQNVLTKRFQITVLRSEGLPSLIRRKAAFPSRLARWCTDELKLKPVKAYLATLEDPVSAVGVRADESVSRAKLAELEDSDLLGAWVWRPLLRWSVEDVIAIHKKHGMPMNPLYLRGHDRVGCYPCHMASKEEIRLIAKHSPQRIDEIREMEREVEVERRSRNAETPGRYTHERGAFFKPRDTRTGVTTIDRVVRWARTSKGKQLPLLDPTPSGGCFRWGLCEAPSNQMEDDHG